MTSGNHHEAYEAIVIGAGVCGIYQIKRLVDLGVRATALELSADLGGTWYNNRYPGARFDSESYTYGYSFSREVLDEWWWRELFSGQPENLRYLNFVADKFDLKRHMQFNARVARAVWDEDARLWRLDLKDGRILTCRFLIMGLGLLSQPTLPKLPGREDFRGCAFHTYDWPHDPLPLKGKKVAIIGTGATAIQIIPEIAREVGDLHVFQRRPNWAAPLNNTAISKQDMAAIRQRYDEIFAACSKSPGGFEHHPDRRDFATVPHAERIAFWDRLYDEPGFGIWLQNFRETFTDEAANKEISDYIAGRIRARVNDPALAEKLIPKDHGFGVQRVPLESHYFEAYNRDNVHLVDLQETPLERITETGIRTTARDYPFDIIIYSTGFDAMTGAYDHIDIRGTDGRRLKSKWDRAVQSYLGMMVHGFPNMVMPAGPQSGSASSNYPRGIEAGVNWTTELLQHVRANGVTRFEATAAAEADWTAEVVGMYASMLMRNAQSWFTGYNSNVKGHEKGKPRYLVYNGGAPKYMKLIREVAAEGYRGVAMDGAESSGAATVATTAATG